LAELEEHMARPELSAAELQVVLETYSTLQERFESLGGYARVRTRFPITVRASCQRATERDLPVEDHHETVESMAA
jgi:hypothetical protein